MARAIRHRHTAARWLASGVAAGVVALLSILGIEAQGNDQLQLFISATDANGAPVTDLKPEDIAMTESGTPGKVLTLERYHVPVNLTIVVDNGPDSDRVLDSYLTGLSALAETLPPDLEVTLITSAPQPRTLVRSSTDRGALKKAFGRLGRDSDDPRFTDSLVEFARRLERDVKDKKLNYQPALIMISTIAGDPSSYQLGDVENAMRSIATTGSRVMIATTTSKRNDSVAMNDLTLGRQGTIGAQLAKATRGDFRALPDPSVVGGLLGEWGKQLAASHTRQTAQYRLVLQRPVSTPLDFQKLDLRLTRPGLNTAVSGDGRF